VYYQSLCEDEDKVYIVKAETMRNFKILSACMCLFICLIFVNAYSQEELGDGTIKAWIENAFEYDVRIHEPDIVVNVHEGIVTLTGTVKNLAEEKFALQETQKISGVIGIINELQIIPVKRSDSEIASDVERRFKSNPLLKDKVIQVSVSEGGVQLAGIVHSISELKEAQVLASEVMGVVSVINGLQINYPAERTDKEIAEDVRSSLQRDVYLTGMPVEVSVNNGLVTLSGKVSSLYLKVRAGNDVNWIWNVQGLQNNIDVDWWEEQDVRRSPVAPTTDEIKENIENELYQDLRLKDPFNINVDVSFGEVTLTGTVESYRQKQLAVNDVLNVVGVIGVTNMLNVRQESRPDEVIQKDVQTNLNTDNALAGQDVMASVSDGAVTLTGNVETTYQKLHAENIAYQVEGVQGVINELDVNWILDYADSTLQKRIKDRLRQDSETSWVADMISVEVRNKVATLTGEVNFWSERMEAARVAYTTEGITRVENRITIHDVNFPEQQWYNPNTDYLEHFVLPEL
jgi:osmotically-inducible protein OsmY